MSRRSCQIAILVALMVVEMLPAVGASFPTAVSGVVRDSRGTPQMGALVELMAADSTVVAQAYTNLHGAFVFEHIFPGTYQLKATGASFLPTLRQNLHIRSNNKTVVNLTLSTLFEAIQWLPAQPRSPDEPSDDWKWTLRSSSNRPLLRFFEDGPLVVVSGDDQSAPQLEARIAVNGAAREFGRSGPHNAFAVERTSAGGGHLILRADLSPLPAAVSSEYLAGYKQPLGPEREIRTVAAFQQTPSIEGQGGQRNFQTMIFRSAETVHLGPNLLTQFGNQVTSVQGPGHLTSSAPFASVSWHSGDASVSYNLATSPGLQNAEEIADSETLAPQFSEVNGTLRMQHGLHQELRVEDDAADYRALVAVYRDQIQNPIVAGGGLVSQNELAGGDLLYDPVAQMIRVAGPAYSSNGLKAEFAKRVGATTWASLSYTNGNALVDPVTTSTATVSQQIHNLSVRRSQAIAAAVNGTIVHSGTHWRASYRWQPAGAVTPVDLYDDLAQDAFLSVLIRQPIHCGRLLPNGTEALVAVRNLLAEGYRPFLTPDGNTLYFAQADRAIQGGLSFSF